MSWKDREVDVPNIAEVDTAILETSGRVSVLKKQDYLPVTPEDMKLNVVESGLPVILVNDGKVIEKNLKSIGYDKLWLQNELQKFGVMDIRSVYLAAIDGSGKIYCSLSNQ